MKKTIIKPESINTVNSSIDICTYAYKIINEKRKKRGHDLKENKGVL